MLAIAPGGNSARRIALATKYACVAIGDSHTFNFSHLTPSLYYPFLVMTELQRLGCSVAIRNSGSSGDTTAQVRARALALPAAQSGSIGIIYAGTNDWGHLTTVQAAPAPTTTTFSVGAGVGQWFPVDSNILINGVSRRVSVQSTDDITITPALPSSPVAGQAVMLDEETNLVETGEAMVALGYTRLIVGQQHYLNFSQNGDTLSTPEPNAIRGPQIEAALTLGAVQANFYTFMKDRIIAGTDVQGSFTWHVADLDSHLNAYGESLLAQCITAAIPESWVIALRT